MGRLKSGRHWIEDRRDTIIIVLVGVAFGWLILQSHQIGKTATEAKSAAGAAKHASDLTQDDTQRLEVLSRIQQDAYCKLKLYDELSGVVGGRLFARLGVLPPRVAKGVSDALKLVASIPSPKKCDTSLTPAKGHKAKIGDHRVAAPVKTLTSTSLERQILNTPITSMPRPVSVPPRAGPRGRTGPRGPAGPPAKPPAAPPMPAPPVQPPAVAEPAPHEPPGHEREPPGRAKGEGPLGLPCPQVPITERILCHDEARR